VKKIRIAVVCALAAGVTLAFSGNDLLRAVESDAPSRSIGRPAAGRLQHGKRLPSRGPGFRTYSRLGSLLGRTAVHSAVRAAVLDAFSELHHASPDARFVVGETGWPRGGPFWPHRTHQNGMSVDFMVPVRSSGAVAELPTWPWNRFGYGIQFDETGKAGDLQIDFEAIAIHLYYLKQAARAHGLDIDRVIFAPDLQPELFRTRAARRIKDVVPFLQRPVWIRHDDHYHVDFRVGASS
jgi:penicillin-insensitive murein endopeptidase